MIWKNETKNISVFEKNGSRIKRFRKPERSDGDEAQVKWLQQQKGDNVTVSSSNRGWMKVVKMRVNGVYVTETGSHGLLQCARVLGKQKLSSRHLECALKQRCVSWHKLLERQVVNTLHSLA
jgi:hypothetical protein